MYSTKCSYAKLWAVISSTVHRRLSATNYHYSQLSKVYELIKLLPMTPTYISRFAKFLWMTTMTTDGQNEYITLCTCTRGNQIPEVEMDVWVVQKFLESILCHHNPRRISQLCPLCHS